jgi:LAGLIDADG endonuclease
MLYCLSGAVTDLGATLDVALSVSLVKGSRGAQGFNFAPFFAYYVQKFPGQPLPSVEFLTWFIGFSEGDGCFCVRKGFLRDNSLLFEVYQGTPNRGVLDYILQNLGFGYINKHKAYAFVYRVTAAADIRAIILIFNGHVIVPTRKERIDTFVTFYNLMPLSLRGGPVIAHRKNNLSPTLKDNWILGFTEAEGTFSCNLNLIDNRRYNFITRYSLCQKGKKNIPLWQHLIDLFGGGGLDGGTKGEPKLYRYIIRGVNLGGVPRIYPYFDNCKFIGIKGRSYELFKELVADGAAKKHLTLEGGAEMNTRCKLINNAYAEMRKAKKLVEAKNDEALPVPGVPHPSKSKANGVSHPSCLEQGQWCPQPQLFIARPMVAAPKQSEGYFQNPPPLYRIRGVEG